MGVDVSQPLAVRYVCVVVGMCYAMEVFQSLGHMSFPETILGQELPILGLHGSILGHLRAFPGQFKPTRAHFGPSWVHFGPFLWPCTFFQTLRACGPYLSMRGLWTFALFGRWAETHIMLKWRARRHTLIAALGST